jgi:DNA damage-binding protein 1
MSDDSGRLIAFPWVFEYDSNDTRSVRVALVDLGTASPASSLTKISPSHLFLASANGDSSLLSFDLPPPGPPTSPLIGSGSRRKSKSKREDTGCAVGDISVGAPTMGGTQVLERWMNLAPVKDFCVVGEEGGGSVSLTSQDLGWEANA